MNIDELYDREMSKCKTPDELAALLEEWRRVRAGWPGGRFAAEKDDDK